MLSGIDFAYFQIFPLFFVSRLFEIIINYRLHESTTYILADQLMYRSDRLQIC